MAWGSTYESHINKIQIKQNHIIRLIFFATPYGKDTESAKPLLNLLNILSIINIYRFKVLEFMHHWHNAKLPAVFDSLFKYASDLHSYNT